MPARYYSVDRDSKLYSIHILGKQLHVELHPNKTSGGFFRIATVEEGEALIGRIQEGIDALAQSNANVSSDADVPVHPAVEEEQP